MKAFFSLIFVSFLLLPAVAWVTGLDFGISVNRGRFKPPMFSVQAFWEKDYYDAADQYFNDSLSLRGPLVYAKNWIDYHLFRTTDSPDVHIGNDGWLYSRKSIDDFRKAACDSRACIEHLALQLHALEKVFQASDRKFVFTVAPNKSTIYPEFVGFVPRGAHCSSSPYDLFLENTSAHFLKSFARLDLPMRKAKKRGLLLYDKKGTHWNSQGAMEVAETISQKLPEAQWEELHGKGKLYGNGGAGDLTDPLMGLAAANHERPFRHFIGPDRPGLPSVVVYGDAFISNLLPYLSNAFRKVDLIRTDHVPPKQQWNTLEPYDVVLFETAESDLKRIQLPIDKIFPSLRAKALAQESQWLGLLEAMPVSRISLRSSVNGLEIKSVGAESVFAFPSVPGSNDEVFRVLRLSIETKRSDIMTVKCLAPHTHVEKRSLKAGTSEVYLPLPFGKSLSMHINPGLQAGLFVLKSAEILGFASNPDVGEADVREQPAPIPERPDRAEHFDSVMAVDEQKRRNDQPSFQCDGIEEDSMASDTSRDQPGVEKKEAMGEPESKEVAPTGAAGISAGKPAITLNEFQEGRVFQRSGTKADIVVSGTFAGHPEAIEARVVHDSTSKDVVPWVVVDVLPRNGIFLGTLHGVPQGGWYNVQVRFQNDHAISDKSLHKWGVGVLIACIGQSNMKEWFHTGSAFEAHELLRKQGQKGWAELGPKGNGAIAFGNRLIERLGIPVGLLDYSENGSGLRKEADWGTGYWENTAPGSIYHRFLAGVSAVGGSVEFVIWMQGEADAARETVTEEEYEASLRSFITNQVRADVGNGSSQENLPFLVTMMMKRPRGKDGPNQAIRNALKRVTECVADCYLAATTLDLKNQGTQHLTPGGYAKLGRRVAQTVLYILGEEKYHRGPSVAAVTQADSRTLDVTIEHRGGTDFTPPSAISGWEVLADGIPVTVSNVSRHDAKTIRIRLDERIVGKTKVRYLYGAMPDTSNPVVDNSPQALPLEELQQ